MRKIVILAFALAVLIALAGCGSKQAVVVNNAAGSDDANAESTKDACESTGAECIKEVETGEYVEMGNVAEGRRFELKIGDAEKLEMVCGAGLSAAIFSRQSSSGECRYSDDQYICVKCPNGSCGMGESVCNCPQDCS